MFRSPMINMNAPSTATGGATSFFTKNIYTIITIIVVIVLLIISYYLYKQWTTNGTAYNANRENGNVETTNANGNKQAELMLFSVDWCPHCKSAKPEWDNLKNQFENKTINGYTIIFTEHNCTNETSEVEELMNKYKIEGYPTIKLLKDNQVIEYDAKPTKSTMEQFLNTVL
jgi:hypothetical protein